MCHNIVDPFEDTESFIKRHQECNIRQCHNIVDPFEDTERSDGIS